MDTIYEIIDAGNFIIGANEEYGLIVTVNYSYLQIWRYAGTGADGNDMYEATYATPVTEDTMNDGLHKQSFESIVDKSLERADEVLTDEENDRLEDDDEPTEYGSFFSRDN